AYVSCGLGVHMVGYVLICYGICDVIGSISFTPIVRKFHRVPVFLLGFAINLSVIITMMHWTPNPDDIAVFFILAGLWGFADAIWQTQINAFYGVIFLGKSEAAFSNYRLWESLGFIIAYAFSTVSCIDEKVITLLVFLCTGFTGYLVIEILEKFKILKRDSEGNIIKIDKLIRG
ncbi:Ion channel regulatory protein UNC-93, partial [Halocaridina rubra]